MLAGNAAAACAGCAAPTRSAATLSLTLHPSGGLYLKAHLRLLSASRSISAVQVHASFPLHAFIACAGDQLSFLSSAWVRSYLCKLMA